MKFLNPENQIAKQKNKNKFFKGEKTMKNTKLKVLVITLAVCLLAMGSLGTLAWFTAEDEVTNNFLIADSEDDADEIFSIDVWEDKTSEDTSDEEKIQDGIKFEDIQPGDDLYKEVNIENTGYYEQYVRATVTITGADVWFDVFDEVFFDLKNFATDLNADFTVDRIEFNADENTIAYTLYYNNILASGEVVNLFTNININEELDRFQAAALSGEFDINVFAEAVQTANVPGPAKEAFAFVGEGKESGEFLVAETEEGVAKLKEVFNTADIVIPEGEDVSFDFSKEDVTLAANNIQVNGKLEIIDGAVTSDANGPYNYAVVTGEESELVINGTDITSNKGGIAVSGKVIFEKGSLDLTATTTNPRYNFYVYGEGSELTINGGDFDFSVKTVKRAYVYADAGATVTINGGTFGTASTRSGYTAGIMGSGTVVIKGGTFGFNPTAWVADGYVANYDDAAKTWTVVAE